MSGNLKPIINVIVTFVVGVACGITFNNWQVNQRFRGKMMPPEERLTHLVDQFTHEIGLSDEQKQRVVVILEAQHQKMEALGQETMPKFEQLREETQRLVREILTPEQQVKFDRRQEKLKGREPHHGPFGPHPEGGPGGPPPPPRPPI